MVSVKVESIMKKEQSSRVIELSKILIKWDSNDNVINNLTNLGAYSGSACAFLLHLSASMYLLLSDDRYTGSRRYV